MISILIADDLSAGTIDKLNEIPEFEIMENATLAPEKLASEIKNADALITSTMSQLPPAVMTGAVNLKIIILTGGEANHMDCEKAKKKNIEIRSIPPFQDSSARTSSTENLKREESAVITILKDFFNV